MDKTELCKSRYLLLLEKNAELLKKQRKKLKGIPTVTVDYKDGKFTIT